MASLTKPKALLRPEYMKDGKTNEVFKVNGSLFNIC